jgi:GAF domain-containing protein
MQALGARVGEFLRLSFCARLSTSIKDRGEVTVHHAWTSANVPSPKSTFRLADYLSEEFSRASRAGETVIVRDASADERVNADTIAQRSIGSFVTVPHHRDGRWMAYLAVATRRAA